MTRHGLRVLGLSVCVGIQVLSASEGDPVVLAAEQAVSAGRPQQAVGLLGNDPRIEEFGALRLAYVDALMAAGRLETVERYLGFGQQGPTADWPRALLGQVWERRGRLAIARGQPAVAAQSFGQAMQHGGVAVDACLLAIASSLDRAGDQALAEHYAERLWHGWRRSAWRSEAGLLLARLWAGERPQRAVDLLIALRLHPDLSDDQWREVHLRLASLLLPGKATDAVLVLEDALQRLPEDLPLRRQHAVAWSLVEPERGRALLADLPADADTRAQLHILRAAETSTGEQWARRLAQADLAWRTGDRDRARELLRPLLSQQVAALLLACDWDWPREELLAEPLAADGRVRARLAFASMAAEDRSVAWSLLQDDAEALLDQAAGWPTAERDRLWLLLGELAAGELQAQAWQRLRREGDGIEGGLAWARRAQESGSVDDWLEALERLPPEHPWYEHAAAALARLVLASLPVGERLEPIGEETSRHLHELVRMLVPLAWREAAGEALRWRFLLLQAHAQLGDGAEARRCLEALLPHADASRQERLNTVAERLARWDQRGDAAQ